MSGSEDEFEIECEEIILSDSEDRDPLKVNSECDTEDESTSTKKDEKNLVPLRGISLNMLPDATKLKYIRRPTRPVRLFSFTDRDIMNRFSKTTEASKSLAMRLLDIVKSVNLRRPVKIENGVVVPNFYLMATQCKPKEGEKVTKLDSMDIVNLVKDIIHMIKIGVYRRVDFVDIICDSPAIFMIKYIHVKNWDKSMNAVYVVTSEYLLPYLCKIRAAEEAEEKAEKRSTNVRTQREEHSKKMPAKRKCTAESVIVEKKNVAMETKNEPKSKSETVKRAKKNSIPKLIPKPEPEPNVEPEPESRPEDDVDTAKKIMNKYLDPDAVHFFTLQMKVSGKKGSHRWSEDDKIFASNLLRANPTEYNLLSDHYSLPAEKTLKKFKEPAKPKEVVKQREPSPKKSGPVLRRSARKR